MSRKNSEQSVKIKINRDIDDKKKVKVLIKNRSDYIDDIIRNTMLSMKEYKSREIFGNSDLHMCRSSLNDLFTNNKELKKLMIEKNSEENIDELQKIIDKMSVIISSFGTKNMDDLLYITFGSEFKLYKKDSILNAKLELIRKYVHPIGFKILNEKKKSDNNISFCIDKIKDTIIQIEKAPELECFDYEGNITAFNFNISGIKIVFHSETNKTMIVTGYIEDIDLDFFENLYIDTRKEDILKRLLLYDEIDELIARRMINSMTLKDIMINGNEDMLKKYKTIILQTKNLKNDRLERTIKHFADISLISQRGMLINLLINNRDNEVQYITYLLYDLITLGATSDANEQMILYESFPSKIKEYFKDAMKHTLNYTQDMNKKYDLSRITIEQQIYILKVPDNIKEKAMVKLKEIKGKSDESGAKAKQFLEGLLKIPFDNYREEPILQISKKLNEKFKNTLNILNTSYKTPFPIENKLMYTNLEISNHANMVLKDIIDIYNPNTYASKLDSKHINSIFKFLKRNKMIDLKIPVFNSYNQTQKKKAITNVIKTLSNKEVLEINSIVKKKRNALRNNI